MFHGVIHLILTINVSFRTENQRKKQKIEEAVMVEKLLVDVSDEEQEQDSEFHYEASCESKERSEAKEVMSDDLQELLDNSTGFESTKTKSQTARNYMPIENTVSAGVRYGLSATQTAAVATGFLKDLIDAGILGPEYSYLAIDKSKVMRAKAAVMGGASEESDRECMEGEVRGIFLMEGK